MPNRHSREQLQRNSQHGGVIVFASILCFALCGILALVVDAFLLRASHTQVSNNAEYAALAAVKAVAVENLSLEIARRRAEYVAGMNIYVGTDQSQKTVQSGELDMSRSQDARAGEILFGNYNAVNGSFEQISDCSMGCNAVQVRLWTASERNFQTLFSKIWNYEQIRVASRATAFFDKSELGGGQAPFFIVNPAPKGA